MLKSILQISSFLGLLLISSFAISCPVCKEEQIKIGIIPVQQKCIEARGSQLYMQIAGDGEPTVIFESGLGDTSGGWNKVISQVAKFNKTLTYDRNGLGRSKNHGTTPRTAQDAVDNLRILLAKSHINPPYILVGHSLGGLYMQLFARQHPKEVVGIVLVDSATVNQNTDQPLPPTDAPHYLEAKGLKQSIKQVNAAPSFPSSIPLTILASGQRGKEWVKLQNQLMSLSRISHLIVTDESGHHIQNEKPDLVIDAIQTLLTSTKNTQQGQVLLLINEFISARAKHDTKAALKPFADNIVWKTSWGETLHGKQALKEMFVKQFKDNITNEIAGAPHVDDNKVTLLRRVTMESWKKKGIDYLIEETEVRVKNNKIFFLGKPIHT